MLILPFICVLSGYIVSSGGMIGYDVIIPIISAILVLAGGIALNDYFDTEADKLGAKNRPIPSGNIKKEDALAFGITLTIIAIVVASLSSNHLLPIVAGIMAILGLTYNCKTKGLGMLGNVTFGMAMCTIPIMGWAEYTNQIFDLRLLLIVIVTFFGSMSTQATSNFYDYKTDKKVGYRTLPIIYGVKKAANIVILIRYFAVIFFIIFLITADLYKISTLVIAIVLCGIPIIIYKFLIESEETKNAKKAFGISVIHNILLFIGLFVGIYL